MLRDFRKGYEEAGGPSVGVFFGSVLGMTAETALKTVVVILVLRFMGVMT